MIIGRSIRPTQTCRVCFSYVHALAQLHTRYLHNQSNLKMRSCCRFVSVLPGWYYDYVPFGIVIMFWLVLYLYSVWYCTYILFGTCIIIMFCLELSNIYVAHCVCVCVRECVYVRVRACACACASASASACACACVCVCVMSFLAPS